MSKSSQDSDSDQDALSQASSKTVEYIHNFDYQQQMQRKEWLKDEKIKAKLHAADELEKKQKRLREKKKRDDDAKKRFNDRVQRVKAKMAEGQLMAEAIANDESPPRKKAAVAKKVAKKTPQEQPNKLTNYFSPVSRDSSSGPPATVVEQTPVASYPVFNTAPADYIGSFRYPMPLKRTPITVTPYTSNDITSVYSAISPYAKEKENDSSGVDFNTICRGCQNPYRHCMERKWRKPCLHRVMDFLRNMTMMGFSVLVFTMPIIRRFCFW